MADEIAVDAFLDILRQSDLVSKDQMHSLTAELSGEGTRPESAQKLADDLVKRDILTPWQAEMLLQGKHRGFRLGPYRILRPLGQGGMSKVVLAEHEMMRRRCAIKVLPSKYQEDQDLLNRFHLEARAIAALDHPNIVRAYDFNKDVRYGKEIHYLVMEYVDGVDLRRMVEEQGPLDYRKAADFICQAADGLAHAHAAGFVHRDIKPANLLVDSHGVLKVLDLGLAMFTFEAEHALNPAEGGQSAVGTADYVAPEQVVDSQNVDGRADIYSLGHTFYFLLTGRRPFAKSTIMELLMAHRTERPEPIGKTRPDVPLELEQFIDKMTAKSPFQRHQTAKEVSEKLRKWMTESGSGRGYSRISALMAEALRAKQPSSGSLPQLTPEPVETRELELASLEDEKAGGQGTAKAAPTAGEPAKKETQTVAGGSPKTEKRPATTSSVLRGLDSEDLLSTLPPAEVVPTLVAGQSQIPHAAWPSAGQQGSLSDILKSPWPWVGATGAVILGLVVLLVIWFNASSTKPPIVSPEKPTATQGDTPPPAPVQPPKIPSSTKSVESPKLPPKPPQSPPKSPPRVVQTPSEAPVQEPPPALPKTSQQPPQKPAEPHVPPSVDVVKELAGLKTLSFTLKSVDPNANSPVNQLIRRQALLAAGQVGLTITEKDSAVLAIELTPSTSGSSPGMVISGELKYTTKDGQIVTVWKKDRRVFPGDPQKSHPEKVMKILRGNVIKFFEQLQKDVREARAKVGAK